MLGALAVQNLAHFDQYCNRARVIFDVPKNSMIFYGLVSQ